VSAVSEESEAAASGDESVLSGSPLERLLDSGPDVVGVYGHRCNTARRGRGDPGDEVIARIIAAGAEPVLAEQRQDIALGKLRQKRLNELDANAGLTWRPLAIDGVCGPASIAAMRRHEFMCWRDVA
jgi:hypothetical protein